MVDESTACAVAVSQAEAARDSLHHHMADGGWYSEEAMAKALVIDGRWEFVQACLHRSRGGLEPLWASGVAGAVIHAPGHWMALRIVDNTLYLLDSLAEAPQRLGTPGDARLGCVLRKYPSVYLVRERADRLDAPGCPASVGASDIVAASAVGAGDHERRRRLGLVSKECPLCTAAVTCAVCTYKRQRPPPPLEDSLSGLEPERRVRLRCKTPDTHAGAPVLPGAIITDREARNVISTKAAAAAGKKALPRKLLQNTESRRLCGNCGVRGHQAVTCLEPCFACGGSHAYYECDHPAKHVVAKRQANRNRVKWQGYNAVHADHHGGGGMKPSRAGRDWVRKEYDPEYTPARDISPKRACLNKFSHISDRARVSLRNLWAMREEEAMECLMDGGFLTDVCLDRAGEDAVCSGTLKVQFSDGKQVERKLLCSGVPEKQRHKFHWLSGSVFQGHTKLDALDVVGAVFAFAAGKNIETAALDTGLNRSTMGHLLDRLRMAACLVAENQREDLVFQQCQVEADETVVRKERVYEDLPGGCRRRIGTW